MTTSQFWTWVKGRSVPQLIRAPHVVPPWCPINVSMLYLFWNCLLSDTIDSTARRASITVFKWWRWLRTIATSLSCSVESSGSVWTEAGYQERENTGQKTQGILAILLELCPHQRLNWSKHKFAEDRYVNELHPTLLSNPFWKEFKIYLSYQKSFWKVIPCKSKKHLYPML